MQAKETWDMLVTAEDSEGLVVAVLCSSPQFEE